MGPWYLSISLGAAIGLWVVLHGNNPADHPAPTIMAKSILGLVLGAIGGVLGSFVVGGLAGSDPMPGHAVFAALATAYVFSGIGTFLGTGRSGTGR